MKFYKLFLISALMLSACGKTEENPTDRFCHKVEQVFSAYGTSWEKYENVTFDWLSELSKEAPEDKKEEAKKQIEELKKQLKKMSSKGKVNELRVFVQELQNGTFKCSEDVVDKVRKHVEDEYPNIFTNYDFCANSDIGWYFISAQNVPTKCLLKIRPYETKVIQQTPDGTLAFFPAPHGFSSVTFLISKNKTDVDLVDNMNIPGGIFVREGNYTYQNVLGSSKTVIKLKRIE